MKQQNNRSRRIAIFTTRITLVVVAVSMTSVATAAAQTEDDPVPPAITDYVNYPLGLGLVPKGCDAQGEAMLDGEMFRIDDGTPSVDLRSLNLSIGARLYMTWSAFAPGCEGLGISLSGKVARTANFDPTVDQYGLYAAYCGPADGTIPCRAPYELSLSLAPRAQVPCFQVDAHAGPQLAVVGPDGAFYRFQSPRNMLIAAVNQGQQDCSFEPCPTNSNIPATVAQCDQTTAALTTTSTLITTTTSTDTGVASGGAELPFTGDSNRRATLIAGTFVAVGALLVLGKRQLEQHHP